MYKYNGHTINLSHNDRLGIAKLRLTCSTTNKFGDCRGTHAAHENIYFISSDIRYAVFRSPVLTNRYLGYKVAK